MRILIDTCIIIDALQNREPFAEDAKTLFLAVANRHCSGFITAKSITDIYYLLHRYTHSDKNTRGILNTLFRLFDILDTTGGDCRKAVSADTADYEDAIMIETAIRSGMDCIVTRNLKDYSKASIPVYHPVDFIKLLKAIDE